MEHKVFHIRIVKPSKSALILLALLLLATAILLFGIALVQKHLTLTGIEAELAAMREDIQRTREELQQQAHIVADSVSSGMGLSRALSGPEILAGSPVIGHALGAANLESSYYNSLEAFQASYAAGVRVFEADMYLTRDGKVVITHDWYDWKRSAGLPQDASIPTLEKFLSTPLQEGHTPLSFRDLLNLMVQYPDVCIVSDTKYKDQEMVLLQFTSMLADAEDMGLTYLFDRIIIQLYSRSMRDYLNTLYPFPHFIYTLYQEGQLDPNSFQDLAAYCAETGVMGITMWTYWWDDSYASVAEKCDVKVYVHTENDIDAARSFLKRGVSAVYTDHLTPDNFMNS